MQHYGDVTYVRFTGLARTGKKERDFGAVR
jgi:hypothetical protein